MRTVLQYTSDRSVGQQKRSQFMQAVEECKDVYKYVFRRGCKRLSPKYESSASRWKSGLENPSVRLMGVIDVAVDAGYEMKDLLLLPAHLERYIRERCASRDVTAMDVIAASMREQMTQHAEDDAQMAFNADPSPENAARLAMAHTVNAGADMHVACVASAFAKRR